MRNGILIIEQPSFSHSDQPSLLPIASEWGCTQSVSWESVTGDVLSAGNHRLILVDAVSAPEKAEAFFASLQSKPIAAPIFAVIPEEDDELLQLAAEVADDFLLWPLRPEELRRRITRILGSRPRELNELQASLTAEIGLSQLVGEDPAFQKVLQQVCLFGASDAPVLITGETGTGKEVCARAIHMLGKRRHGPFIPVDCGAIPDHLFENEIFGHSRGAFTDAHHDQKGLVALADHGTLFMDEIDSLSTCAQSKVLRLLQEHTYRPLGSDGFKQADLRVIAATNRDLDGLIAQKSFRSDLAFRVNVLRIHLPALRERRGDIAVLSRHFVDEICRANSVPRKMLSLAAIHRLEGAEWPGNVRELCNVIQRAVLLSPGSQIAGSAVSIQGATTADDLASTDSVASCCFQKAKLKAIEAFESTYVKQVLGKHQGNVTRAAREAGKDRRAFGKLAKKYGVTLQPGQV